MLRTSWCNYRHCTISVLYHTKKLKKLQDLGHALLTTASKSKRWVRERAVEEFAGKAVSQLLPLPLARFFTRGIYDDLKADKLRRNRYPQQSIRLSNAGLRDLKAWKVMLTGDCRLIGGGSPQWSLHTDAAELGYGATFGTDMNPGSPGEVEVQGIWSPFLRLKSITHRELLAVRLSLESDLVKAKLSGSHHRLVLHVDNMAVFHIVNNMVSANSDLMDELRHLHSLLQEIKITVQAKWLPSALNRHADRLSRTWNPRDLKATPSLMQSLQESLHLQQVRRYWPLGLAPAARAKVIKAQRKEHCGDGRSRLWNPSPEWIPQTLLKIQAEGAHGIIVLPHWTGAVWYGLLKRICLSYKLILPTDGCLFTSEYVNPKWALEIAEVGPSHQSNKHSALQSPLSSLKLKLENASRRLASSALCSTTGQTKTSQRNKFKLFCQEEGHQDLPARLSTVLAYVGYLFEEDRIHGNSIDHYISAVRTHHVRKGFQDPCTGPHLKDLIRAFNRKDDEREGYQDVRAALPASIVRRIRNFGLRTNASPEDIRDTALIEFQFLMTWRESSARSVQVQDVDVSVHGQHSHPTITISAKPRTLKGRLIRNAVPGSLTCSTPQSSTPDSNPLALQLLYFNLRSHLPPDALYWSLQGERFNAQFVTEVLSNILSRLQVTAPSFCYYTSHSLRSGSATAMILTGVPLPVIMARGPWRSQPMVNNVYYDPRLRKESEMID